MANYPITNYYNPLLKRYPVPIYPAGLGPRTGFGTGPLPTGNFGVGPTAFSGGYNLGPVPNPGPQYGPIGALVRHDILGTTYGTCDCSISSGYPKTNDCQSGGFPVCVPGGCMCYNPILQNAGCFDERGSTC